MSVQKTIVVCLDLLVTGIREVPVQSIIVIHKKSEVFTQKHILYPDGTGNCIRKTKVLCLIIPT